MTSRTALGGVVLALALVAPPSAASTQLPPQDGPQQAQRRAAATRVLAISVDGLNVAAIKRLGARGTPTLHRMLREGAGTLNARTEVEQSVTLPNHTSMMTGRRINAARGGHGVTWDDDRPGTTVERAAGHGVASVFTVAHAAGDRTALFSTKEKFELYDRSWPTGIDRFRVDEDQGRLVRTALADLRSGQHPFTFLHVSLPDRYGHAYGGMSARYLQAVRRTDRQLGTILAAVRGSASLSRSVAVVLTADHGFAPGRTSHSDRSRLANDRIPFLVWGAGVARGDLYALNPDYRNPGTTRPSYAAARQPVRNGDLGNVALDLLGLRPIPGSELDASFDLDVS